MPAPTRACPPPLRPSNSDMPAEIRSGGGPAGVVRGRRLSAVAPHVFTVFQLCLI